MLIIVLTILATILLSGCTRTAEPVSQVGFYLDTVVRITLYSAGDGEACDRNMQECFALIDNYEHLFSATIEGSDVWNINHGGGHPVTVSDDTASLLRTALYYSELSEGRVDLTVLPLSELWDFGSDRQPQIPDSGEAPLSSEETATTPDRQSRIPDAAAIEEALSHIGYRAVKIEGNTVTLADPDAAVDLGFIAKGYIADRLKDYLLGQGVESACISLGGNLITIGKKPDGQPYRIGVQKPFAREGETVATLNVTDASVVSSGIYERYFYENDALYHHLLDTRTGYPADNNIAGVTILSSASVEADALSTTCYFLGLEDGMELIESLDGVEALFVAKDGMLSTSSGFPLSGSR